MTLLRSRGITGAAGGVTLLAVPGSLVPVGSTWAGAVVTNEFVSGPSLNGVSFPTTVAALFVRVSAGSAFDVAIEASLLSEAVVSSLLAALVVAKTR